MKHPAVIVAFVIGVSLMVSAGLLSSAIKEYGRSIEKAASHRDPAVNIPSSFTVSFQGGASPLRIESNSNP